MRVYRRRLPHIDAPGSPVFVTWRLSGSLPEGRSFEAEDLTSVKAFVLYDRLLDGAEDGPLYLKLPSIAEVVRDQLLVVDSQKLCKLHGYVIMPNHVHVLWTPRISLSALVMQVKGPTAVIANRLLGLKGKPFWQAEYFDRQIRNDQDFQKVKQYIEWNPVRALLAAAPEYYPWSSAYRIALPNAMKAKAGALRA